MSKFNSDKCRYLTDDGVQCRNSPRDGGYLCDVHLGPSEMDVEVFRAVTDHFKQDIREFFRRSNFYLLTEAAFLSVFFAKGTPTTKYEFVVGAGIVLSGVVVASFWWVAVRGAVIWIDRWRDEVRSLDDSLDRFRSYSRVEENAIRSPYQSPERITQYLPVLFALIWILAGVYLVMVYLYCAPVLSI